MSLVSVLDDLNRARAFYAGRFLYGPRYESGLVSLARKYKGTGLTAMVTSASICSVMRMLPSSAAIALPARAATMSAANTGAISRVSETATT